MFRFSFSLSADSLLFYQLFLLFPLTWCIPASGDTSYDMDSSGNPSGKIHPFGYFWVFFMMSPTKSASK